MEKEMIGKARVGVSPVAIVGAIVNGKANFATLGGYGGMAQNPPLVYITLAKPHYTNAGIRETGYFSVNLPGPGLVKETDYVGLVSGRNVDKSRVFKTFYGSVDRAPMIEECPINILCKVFKEIDLPNNDVFIGEIVEVYVDRACLTDGKPDITKINPLLLATGAYWCLGKQAGTAYLDGKSLIKK